MDHDIGKKLRGTLEAMSANRLRLLVDTAARGRALDVMMTYVL